MSQEVLRELAKLTATVGGLSTTVDRLSTTVDGLCTTVDGLRADVDTMRTEMATKDDLAEVRAEMATKDDLAEVRAEMASGFTDVRREMAHYHDEAMREAHARDLGWVAQLESGVVKLDKGLREWVGEQLEQERVALQKAVGVQLEQERVARNKAIDELRDELKKDK